MTNPTPTPPLWRVMHDAFHAARDNDIATPGAHAAELRAVAREAAKRYNDNDPAVSVIAWFETEADRAELGE